MPHIFRHFNNYKEERFASALLASILEVSKNFRKMFIEHCLQKYKQKYLYNDVMNIVETEVYTNTGNDYEGRIDILIRDHNNELAIGIEVKIESSEIIDSKGVTQTQFYKEWLDSNYKDNNALIYLTKYGVDVKNKLYIHVLWGEVIKIISDVISLEGEENSNILLFEFRKYIEEEIMKFNGFSFQDKFSKGDCNLKLLMDEIYSFVTTLSEDYIKLKESRYTRGYDYENKLEYDYYYCVDKKSGIEVGISSFKEDSSNKQNVSKYFTGNRFQVWKNDNLYYDDRLENIVDKFKVGTKDLHVELQGLAKDIVNKYTNDEKIEFR